MKVINLKLKSILLIILVLILVCIFLLYKKEIMSVVKVNATPITSKVIVLDAGHGVPDYGTQSKSGTTEQEINLAVVLKLQSLIEQSGAKVILTRSDNNGIYEVDKISIRDKKVSDMKNRVYIGNNSNANLYVSIHMNYYEQEKYSGWQVFYQRKNEKSKNLANFIQESLNENINKNSRIIMPIKGAYIMDKINIPAVIVECGFLSNAEDERKLKTDEYQNTLAWGIYIGLQKYFAN